MTIRSLLPTLACFGLAAVFSNASVACGSTHEPPPLLADPTSDAGVPPNFGGNGGSGGSSGAAGSGGWLLQGAWESVPSGTTKNLMTVYGFGAADVWIGGEKGTLLHWDGATLKPAAAAISNDIGTIFGTTAMDVWALSALPTDPLSAVSMHKTSGDWFPGPTPKVVDPDVTKLSFTGMFGRNKDELWATDRAININDKPSGIYKWDGSAWTYQFDGNLDGIWGASSGPIWAVGAGGTLRRYDDKWSIADSDLAGPLHAVHGTGPTDVWAVGTTKVADGVGDAFIMHYDGTAWAAAQVSSKTDLRAVVARSATDAWAMGSAGGVLHWDGTAWTVSESLGNQTLRAAWTNNQEMWLVGDGGVVFHYH